MGDLRDIFGLVARYLAGSVELRNLEEWVAARLPALLRDPESDESRMAGVIELALAEFGRGDIDEREVRDMLTAALPFTPVIRFDMAGSGGVRTSSSSTAIGRPDAIFSIPKITYTPARS